MTIIGAGMSLLKAMLIFLTLDWTFSFHPVSYLK